MLCKDKNCFWNGPISVLCRIEKEERLRTQNRGKHKVGRAEREKETDVGTLQAMMDYDVGFKGRKQEQYWEREGLAK